MEATFQKIKQVYAEADLKGRMEIQGFIRELQVGFYSDWDVVMRLASGPLQLSLVRTGINLGIFERLQKSTKPIHFGELQEVTGAATLLLDRILRTLAAFGFIKEIGDKSYGPTGFTRILADENAAGAIANLFDVAGPSVQALPEFLAGRKYQDITRNTDTAFNKAFGTDEDLFTWMMKHPEHMKSLGHLMALQRTASWTDSYPLERALASSKPDDTLLVDIGGGFGQQALAFRSKVPDHPGRVVVQDIASTLQARQLSQPTPGVAFVEHNFFQPQPIQNARFYYLRHVLHDWTDDKCVEILRNVVSAMGPESQLVIDELVLPETGVPWQAAFMDVLMMASFSSIERTRGQWDTLLDKAGLKIVDVHQYDPKKLAVIFTAPKEVGK